ncbi:MAG TPA: hypothetical protein PL124_11335 [Candidatus Cloacimonadota bacterium]|nr:hypothetical protein [Candidatus Cloacimonadota bacterium]HPS39999.1 hypothetical protein [Candidatus Cloacimonadota bacterium]
MKHTAIITVLAVMILFSAAGLQAAENSVFDQTLNRRLSQSIMDRLGIAQSSDPVQEMKLEDRGYAHSLTDFQNELDPLISTFRYRLRQSSYWRDKVQNSWIWLPVGIFVPYSDYTIDEETDDIPDPVQSEYRNWGR